MFLRFRLPASKQTALSPVFCLGKVLFFVRKRVAHYLHFVFFLTLPYYLLCDILLERLARQPVSFYYAR